MTPMPDFNGFPRECVQFLRDLADNNSREWFAQHKKDYEQSVTLPARQFVQSMGSRLKELSPGIVADPRVDKSIFRPYRDTRFSADKSPYKTHLGIFMWEGERPKMECSGFYFHLEPPNLMVAAGIHCFSKPLLGLFRDAAVAPESGAALAKAIERTTRKKEVIVGGKHYKKTPRGYDPQHENAELLLYNGLWAAVIAAIPDELHSGDLVDYCFPIFKEMLPLHKWLVDMTRKPS
jgi:uncharacterized protein (TIGR02453 family)